MICLTCPHPCSLQNVFNIAAKVVFLNLSYIMQLLTQNPPKVASQRVKPIHKRWPLGRDRFCPAPLTALTPSFFSLHFDHISFLNTSSILLSENISVFVVFVLSTLNALPPNSFMAHFLLTQGHHLNLTLSDHLPTLHTSRNSCPPFLFYFVLSNLYFLTLIYCVFYLGFPLEYKYQVCNDLSVVHNTCSVPKTAPGI